MPNFYKSLAFSFFMRTVQPESFSVFSLQAEKGNVVPVTLTIPADLQTPFGIYLLLRENGQHLPLYKIPPERC